MKIINNDFYTNNWQDFVHQWVMKKVDRLVQRYNLPVDVDTIESVRIDTTEDDNNNFVFTYTKDKLEHTLTITTKHDKVEISISDNSTWVVNGEDTGKNTAGQMGLTGEHGERGVRGDKGPQGLKGKTGVQGPKGERGETGDKGATGEIGERGPQGLQGKKGLQGETGERGVAGSQGEKGLQGKQGLKGETGDKGPQGIAGTITGDKGPTGTVGPKGEPGDKGPAGSKGPQGVIGETGDKGPQGDRGEQGPQGDRGPEGPQGPIGPQGEKGDSGVVDITLNNDGNFYVNDEDSGKTWQGLPGKITGLTYDEYWNNIYKTSGPYSSDIENVSGSLTAPKMMSYGLYGTINYNSDNFAGWTYNATSSMGSYTKTYWLPTRSDVNLFNSKSFPTNKTKLFSSSVVLYNARQGHTSDKNACLSGIKTIPFGYNTTSSLLNNVTRFNSKSEWLWIYNCSLNYSDNTFNILDVHKYNLIFLSMLTGIVKITDLNNNVRTFQPVCVVNDFTSFGQSYSTIVLRAYTKGPQSQWSNTFSSSGNYDVKIDIIDNDGNPVDYENGTTIVGKYPKNVFNLWSEHHREMED